MPFTVVWFGPTQPNVILVSCPLSLFGLVLLNPMQSYSHALYGCLVWSYSTQRNITLMSLMVVWFGPTQPNVILLSCPLSLFGLVLLNPT